MKRPMMLGALLVLLLTPGLALAQQPGPVSPEPPRLTPRQGPRGAQRLQRLQEQVFARFMDRASQRLGLSAGDRSRLEQVMRANEMQRRELAREARTVRQELAAAARDPNTPQSDYDRLLREMSDLRGRDLDLWRSEQAQLATVLTPKQRAQFMAMRIEFFEMVQRMRQRRAQADAAGPGLP